MCYLDFMITYLFMDCEMGGRDLKYSLLTAYFYVTDAKFNKLGDLYLEVKPDDGDYIVSGQGMTVNKIDLIEHDSVAFPYKMAKPLLYNFLSKMNKQVGGHLTPVGHGIKGDIDHVIDKLISRGSWEQFCTYHFIDTSVVLQYLRACGMMDENCDGSVVALAKHFNIQVEGADHDCRVDTLKTLGIFREFIRIGTGDNKAVKGPILL
jgi:hypothetical protein